MPQKKAAESIGGHGERGAGRTGAGRSYIEKSYRTPNWK